MRDAGRRWEGVDGVMINGSVSLTSSLLDPFTFAFALCSRHRTQRLLKYSAREKKSSHRTSRTWTVDNDSIGQSIRISPPRLVIFPGVTVCFVSALRKQIDH